MSQRLELEWVISQLMFRMGKNRKKIKDNKMVEIITRIIDSVKLMVDKILRLREKNKAHSYVVVKGHR